MIKELQFWCLFSNYIEWRPRSNCISVTEVFNPVMGFCDGDEFLGSITLGSFLNSCCLRNASFMELAAYMERICW
jgi:hypothetical protein